MPVRNKETEKHTNLEEELNREGKVCGFSPRHIFLHCWFTTILIVGSMACLKSF